MSRPGDWIRRQPIGLARLRLFLTTGCPFRCRYCFVEKRDRTLSAADADRAVDLLLRSPGREKRLLVLGGEPLREPARLRQVAERAAGLARTLHRRLHLVVATNGVHYRAEEGRRLRALGVRLAVSIDGEASTHDRFRRYRDGRATWADTAASARAVLADFGPARACALMAVHPSAAGRAARNFAAVTRLGFDSVNLEPIQGVSWSPAARAAFRRSLERILAGLRDSLAGPRPLFLNSVNRALADGGRRPAARCLLEGLEVWPGGGLFLSPEAAALGGAARIGTLARGWDDPVRACSGTADGRRCPACRAAGAAQLCRQPAPALEWRNRRSAEFAAELRARAGSEPAVRSYMARARSRLFE